MVGWLCFMSHVPSTARSFRDGIILKEIVYEISYTRKIQKVYFYIHINSIQIELRSNLYLEAFFFKVNC